MKKIFRTFILALSLTATAVAASAQSSIAAITDPDGMTTVYIGSTDGVAWYSIDHGNSLSMPASRLGLKTDAYDWSYLEFAVFHTDEIVIDYEMDRSKTSKVKHRASTGTATFVNPEGQKLFVEFVVSRNDVAFRYLLPKSGETGRVRVLDELTEFCFLDSEADGRIETFLTPQSHPMVDWKRTKPSYEEYYGLGKHISEKSEFGHGYTFPGLIKVGKHGWALLSETGVDSRYCGSRLGDSKLSITDNNGTPDDASDNKLYYSYKIEFPMPEENNGNGTVEPAFSLPGATPWRTITLGETLHPIAETTVAWDLVDPLYETEHEYKYGKGTWSWIVWQDASINYNDQIRYIDLAAAMGFEYVLVDSWWDSNIGRDGIEKLVAYANEKGVDVFLWYSSSGWWNDIVQGPINVMSNPISRKKEMRWMRDLGIKGIKVDFFGGDKQETMRHYEAILSDADDHGLMVIFHGCTLPRGWERMYPNFVGSEAVRASENLVFRQYDCDHEAEAACIHPFIRNTVGSMEYGGCFMNENLSKSNMSGSMRRTTDVFQIATLVLFQNPIQNVAIAPNNLEDAPAICMDFIREVPTTWDETRLVYGYPGKHVTLARRHGKTWYVASVNAGEQTLKYNLWEMLEDIRNNSGAEWKIAQDGTFRIYEGGNSPVIRNIPAGDIYKADLSVAGNDGAVIVFEIE